MEKWAGVEERLGQLIKEMQDVQVLRDWKWKAGDIKGASLPDFDDRKWQKVNPGHHWPAAKTSAWLRKKIIIPGQIQGIDTEGSPVDIRVYIVSIGGEVFLNGKRIRKEDFWLDADFCLSAALKKEGIFHLAIRTNKGEGYGNFASATLFIEKINAMVRKIEAFLQEIKLIRHLGNVHLQKKERYLDLVKKALNVVDIDLSEKGLKKEELKRLLPSLEEAEKILSPVSGQIKKFNLHLVGHAHIDMNWLWTWKNTLDITRRTFATVNQLMEQYPQFHFSQSQAALYEVMERQDPEVFAKIKRRIKEKRWDVTASTWVEGDLNMASGESLVRQTLYAKKYIREKFGVEPKVCWCPDTFGHPWTYPQILKKSGINYYYAHRCAPPENPLLFWWQSPDGSRVLAFNSGETYNNTISPRLVETLLLEQEKTGQDHHLIVYGVGDHGGGPTKRDLDCALELQKKKIFPSLKFTSPEEFFKSILREKKNYPIINNELNFIFQGCYTTHADIKYMNRKGENLLTSAEPFAAISSLYGNTYPHQDFEAAWRNILFNQFHDLLDGSAIHSSYQYSLQLFQQAMKIRDTSHFSKNFAVQDPAINASPFSSLPLTVFNSLCWQRKDIVEMDISSIKIKPPFSLYDEKGNLIPSQINKDKLIFCAEAPSLGYRTYYLGQEKTKTEGKAGPFPLVKAAIIIREGPLHKVENDFFSLTIDASGCIISLFDKGSKKELIVTGSKFTPSPQANVFQLLYEKPHSMSSWCIGQISKIENITKEAKVKIEEEGPVRSIISIEHKFRRSKINQEMIFYKEIPRIDFRTSVHWQEKGGPKIDAPMLKVAFPLNINAKEACFEIPFGYINRPCNGQEAPALKWVDLSQEEAGNSDGYGVSLLNDCKYGYDVQGNTIRLTLLRSAYDPDPLPDIGENRFTYSLYPHKGDWRKGNTVQAAYELNNPLILKKNSWTQNLSPEIPPFKTPAGKNDLPPTFSFLKIEPNNLIMSALKKAEDGKGLILRIYESQGRKTQGKITFNLPLSTAKEVDLMEKDLKSTPGLSQKIKMVNNQISIPFGRHEIKTLRLSN